MKARQTGRPRDSATDRLPNPLAHIYRAGRKRDRLRARFYAILRRLRRQRALAARPGEPAYDAEQLREEAIGQLGPDARWL